MDMLIACAVFLLLAGVGGMLVHRSLDYVAVGHRLGEVTRSFDVIDPLARTGPRSRAAHGLFNGLLPRLDLMRRLEQYMWQAGMYQSGYRMLLLMGGLLVAGLGGGMLVSGDVLISIAAGLGLCVTPLIYIRFKRTRRLKAFLVQLPYALDLIKSSLEAGHTLQRGMQVVEQEFAEPLGSEFRTVVEQTRLGLPITQALADMLARVPEDDLRLFVVAVKVQATVGSSLAQIIARLSDIVRTRQRLFSQIRALTAQSRMSGMVVGLLPAVVLGMFTIVQPSYAQMLFFDHTGQLILKTAAGLDLGAFLLIRRILKVRF
ncbi:MAG: type II secretion system F family protein [Candidatus Binataceae bacterium]|jgi:tight adherence protein B